MRFIDSIDKRHSDLSELQLKLSQDGLTECFGRDASAIRDDENNAWF
jgi:hypothetical protein